MKTSFFWMDVKDRLFPFVLFLVIDIVINVCLGFILFQSTLYVVLFWIVGGFRENIISVIVLLTFNEGLRENNVSKRRKVIWKQRREIAERKNVWIMCLVDLGDSWSIHMGSEFCCQCVFWVFDILKQLLSWPWKGIYCFRLSL